MNNFLAVLLGMLISIVYIIIMVYLVKLGIYIYTKTTQTQNYKKLDMLGTYIEDIEPSNNPFEVYEPKYAKPMRIKKSKNTYYIEYQYTNEIDELGSPDFTRSYTTSRSLNMFMSLYKKIY